MILSGAQMAVKALERNKTEKIFGYPGAAICPLLDKLSESAIEYILVRNEQGAAHMASGYAKASKKTGVCSATSGPGATNLITGIATAFMDSVPMVIITGQVSLEMVGSDAFQEIDITGATAPFTKHNYLVKKVADIPRVIDEAFYLAATGRPGPVLVDIPMDVLLAEYDYPEDSAPIKIRGYNPTTKINKNQVKKAIKAITSSKRPVILAGGGIVSSDATAEFREFAKKLAVPVISTMTAIGTLPVGDEQYFGMVGSHGKKAANIILNHADAVLVLGARLGDRSIANLDNKKPPKLIHIDIDPAELGKNLRPDISVVGDIRDFINTALPYIGEYRTAREWLEFAKKVRLENEDKLSSADNGYVNPRLFIKLLSEKASENAFITTEVGQNQIWTVNYYNFTSPRQLITSAGFGTMGYGLPAAIGAYEASGGQVIAVMGDGSFQMDFCELATLKSRGAPIKMILFENKRLGMVCEYQYMDYGSNFYSVDLKGNPDFAKLAASYGIKSEKITKNSEAASAIDRLLAGNCPYLLVVSVNPDEPTGDAMNNKLLRKEI